MKTQVLQLDIHDDIISTRDKLGWKQTGRILLVWPRKGRVLTRRLDLVLLIRHTSQLGAQLALVTKDPEVKSHAKSLGISIFSTTQEAQHSRWDRPQHWRRRFQQTPNGFAALEQKRLAVHPSPPRLMNKLWLRLSIFSLGVLAVLSVVALLLPTAEITIYPDQKTQSFDIPVQASTDIQEINLSGLLPAQSIEFIIEGRDQITTTGSIALPAAPATGVVQFTNLSVDPVQIPTGTVVRTLSDPAIRFRTTRIASLPGENGAMIDVPVEAIQPGSNGNLGTERLVAIEGPLGINLRVSNSNPTSGGKNQRLKAVSAADQENLFQKLVAALQQTAWEEYQASADPKDLTLQSNAELDQILEEEYSASVGEPADTLELKLRAVYRVYTVLGTDIQAFANSVLDASLPTGYTPIPETLQINHKQIQNNPQNDQTSYDFHIERRVIYQPDLNSLPSTILGLPLAEAYSVLGKNIPMAQEPRIVLFPENWPRLPYLPFRITLNIEP